MAFPIFEIIIDEGPADTPNPKAYFFQVHQQEPSSWCIDRGPLRQSWQQSWGRGRGRYPMPRGWGRRWDGQALCGVGRSWVQWDPAFSECPF